MITAALEQTVGPGRAAGAWTRYCCPVHEADGGRHNPSLIVKYLPDARRTKVQCRAGCPDEEVLDRLGLKVRDLYDAPLPRGAGPRPARRAPRPRQVSAADRAIDAAGLALTKPKKTLGEQISAWTPVAAYPYARADGTVAGEVIRKEATFERGRDKSFTQRRWTDTGWEAGGFELIPFQLPRVLEAIGDGRTVYVCEGEKDVLAAESAGLVATTNAGGALAWKPEHAAWLRGAGTVVVVADRDAPGYHRAEKVMASLSGLAGRVRVLQAATGKDLHDHLQAGHEISELEPIPHLDPFTPTGPAAAAAAGPEIPAAATDVVSAALYTSPEGTEPMGFLSEPSTQVHHDDTVDHLGAQWAAFMRLLLGHLIERARRQAEARRIDAERTAAREAAELAEAEAALAADRAAAVARLRKIREAGLDNASRTEIAAATADAAAWAEDTPAAQKALAELRAHVHQRYGILLHPETGEVDTDAVTPPQLSAELAERDAQRVAAQRLSTAQDRMVEMVAAEKLDESVKQELYGDIEAWRANPTVTGLHTLTRKLADKGVGEPVRTRIRFVATYLGAPGLTVSTGEAATLPAAISATLELRKLPEPLVDLGEEAKPRVDKLFDAYADRLRRGASTTSVRERLDHELAVLTPEDQDVARARGNAIRANPAAKFMPLWPDHVDRDELATTVSMYANLAIHAEAAAVRANDIDDHTAAAMTKQAAKHKAWIGKAIRDGKGLHPLERDQLAAVLRDVEAGVTVVPELLWVDDRSAAASDAQRAATRAQDASFAHRHQVEELLDTNLAPRGTVRRTREELTTVMLTQSELATGRASLSDYEATGAARRFDGALAAAGVGAPLRNRVAAHLDLAAGQAASMGKAAERIAERWEQRRDVVVATRDPQIPAYDSVGRRIALEANLRAAGLDTDQIAERLAADAGSGRPAAAAVTRAPGQLPTRTTAPGAGVHHATHRGKGKGRGRDDNGAGR